MTRTVQRFEVLKGPASSNIHEVLPFSNEYNM